MKRCYKFAGLVCAAAALSFLTACGVNITQITIPADCALTKGDSTALEVVYTPEKETTEEKLAEAAARLSLTWTSADESVATVDESGTVTAVGAGTTEITAAVADTELQSTCAVTVSVPLESLKAPDALALVANGENSAALDVALVPADATDVKLSYASSDPAVATVDANGTVTAVATVDQNGRMVAKAKGSATITVTSADGAVSIDYALTVKAVKCSYCGKEGHTSANCPQKAADEKAAAQRAAQQAAAAQAAKQQTAEQAAAQQAAAAQAAQEQAAQEQAAQEQAASDPAPSGGDSGCDPLTGYPAGTNFGEQIPGLGDNYIISDDMAGDIYENECPPAMP